MFTFLLRTAIRSAVIQKYRFVSLILTIAVASTLLITLASLYLNAESQLSLKLSGIPNMTVEPKKALVNLSTLTIDDVSALKSKKHFWRNNVVNAVPIALGEGKINNNKVKIAGTWFEKDINVDDERYTLGLLEFKGWEQNGEKPDGNSVLVGANVPNMAVGDEALITINGVERTFRVAKTLGTGSYWDDYVFLDLDTFGAMTGKEGIDQILVGALIKPKDNLALKAELYGTDSLTQDEFTAWYCSPYAAAIAYTIKEVVPDAEVRTLRRITEVQEGIIRASSGIFAILFALTLLTSLTAVFAGEKMYTSLKMKEFGIMAAIGASQQKIFLQLLTEISIASLLSAAIAYGLSRILVTMISTSVFEISFQADTVLIVTSLIIPLLTSLASLFFVRQGLAKNVVEILR